MTYKTAPGWTVLCCPYALVTASLHSLTGKQAEKLDPSKVPLWAQTVDHTNEKMSCIWLPGQSELLPTAVFAQFIALYTINKEQVRAAGRYIEDSLKLATRTVIRRRHDCFWCRQSTRISDQLLRG